MCVTSSIQRVARLNENEYLLEGRPSQRTNLAGLLDVCALPDGGLQAVLHVAERLPRLPALLQTCVIK